MYYIFPDIHGQYEKLEGMLTKTGFQFKNGTWKNPNATALFLGDFIDRGTSNGKVLDTIRGMIENGQAQAVMGNHELNAINYHTNNLEGTDGLRTRNDKNTKQHKTFLDEFPLGAKHTQHQLAFMKTLPLAIDLPELRIIHAAWDEKTLSFIEKEMGGTLILSDKLTYQIGNYKSPLGKAIEYVTKGPEIILPNGYGFHDKEGTLRDYIRII